MNGLLKLVAVLAVGLLARLGLGDRGLGLDRPRAIIEDHVDVDHVVGRVQVRIALVELEVLAPGVGGVPEIRVRVVGDRELAGRLILAHARLAEQVLVVGDGQKGLRVLRVLGELRVRFVYVVLVDGVRRAAAVAAVADAERVEDPTRAAADTDPEAEEADQEQQSEHRERHLHDVPALSAKVKEHGR